MNEGMFCQVCGNEIKGKRSSAKYCSSRCKNQAFLARQRQQAEIEKSQTFIVWAYHKIKMARVSLVKAVGVTVVLVGVSYSMGVLLN